MRTFLILLLSFLSAGLWAQLPERIPYRKGNLWGYADTTGKVVIPCRFEETAFFTGDSARVKFAGQYGHVQKNGDFRADPPYTVVATDFNISSLSVYSGEWLWGQAQPTLIPFAIFIGNDLYPVQDERSGLYGYSANGKRILYPQFISAGYFSEGLAPVQLTESQWGFIDKLGNVKMKFPGAMDNTSFSNGLGIVHLETGTGLVNKAGEWVVRPGPYSIEDAGEVYTVTGDDGKIRVLNKYGKTIGTGFESVEVGDNGILLVRRDGKYGFMNHSGKMIVACSYTGARLFSNGMAAVMQDGLNWGFVDEAGRLAIPMKYSSPGDFGYNRLCRAGTLGYIDIHGREYWED
jgi:hypothetical protein